MNGATTLGFYSISYKALGLPLTVVSNNISKVFYKEASIEFQKKGNFLSTFLKISSILIVFSLFLGCFIYFATPIAFDYMLGSNWSESAKYVQILIPMFCVRLVVNTIASGLQIVGKQNIELFNQMILVGASIVSFVIVSYFRLEIDYYLIIISSSFSIVYLIYYLLVLKYSLGRGNLKYIISKTVNKL